MSHLSFENEMEEEFTDDHFRIGREAEIMRTKAEKDIQKILIDLYNDTEIRIAHVNVDTRNYANMDVEIFFSDDK